MAVAQLPKFGNWILETSATSRGEWKRKIMERMKKAGIIEKLYI